MLTRSFLSAFIGLVTFLCLSCSIATFGTAAESELRIGASEQDITPPVGFPMAGYYHERLATGAKDPLKAKAMVIRDGETVAAVVACDLTGVSRDFARTVREVASRETGIPVEHIVVSATHSHTAPDYSRDLYRYLKGVDLSKPIELPVVDNQDLRLAYIDRLVKQTVRAIAEANQKCEPVKLKLGSAQQKIPVSFNRRFVMRDGSVKTWQALSNPDVVRPAGPIDSEIAILQVDSTESGKPVSLFSNYALHLDTVGGLLWSADYPFYVEYEIRKSLGSEVISIFGLGCCGDINHSDPTKAERNKTDFIGGSLGNTIVAALPDLKPVENTRLQVRSAIVPLPLQEVSKPEVDRALEKLAIVQRGEQLDFFEHVTAYRQVIVDQLSHPQPFADAEKHLGWGLTHSWKGVGENLPAEVVVMTIGNDIAVVYLPGEVFVELGLAIKQASPYKTTMVVELSQCVETAYIPTRAATAGGSYEVLNSSIKPGGGELLVEAAIRLLRESASSSPSK